MTVAIVLDPAYRELERLSEQMPVWAVDSLLHRPLAERLWQLHGMADAFQGITLFKVADEKDAENNCINIIGEIDMHHSVDSTGSRIAALRVIGIKPSDNVLKNLASYGFVSFEPTPDGFTARAL